MTKFRHYDNEGTARFVTFSTYRRTNCLLESGVPELLVRHLESVRSRCEIKFFGYVIMPEHVHLVLLPSDGTKLGLVIREIKSKMAREYLAKTGAPQLGLNELGAPQLAVGNSKTAQRVFWQKRCYDHNCRSAATVREKINYCHMNPVKRGLVESPAAYKWSSYNWYAGKSDVPLHMDEYEFWMAARPSGTHSKLWGTRANSKKNIDKHGKFFSGVFPCRA